MDLINDQYRHYDVASKQKVYEIISYKIFNWTKKLCKIEKLAYSKPKNYNDYEYCLYDLYMNLFSRENIKKSKNYNIMKTVYMIYFLIYALKKSNKMYFNDSRLNPNIRKNVFRVESILESSKIFPFNKIFKQKTSYMIIIDRNVIENKIPNTYIINQTRNFCQLEITDKKLFRYTVDNFLSILENCSLEFERKYVSLYLLASIIDSPIYEDLIQDKYFVNLINILSFCF